MLLKYLNVKQFRKCSFLISVLLLAVRRHSRLCHSNANPPPIKNTRYIVFALFVSKITGKRNTWMICFLI